MTRREFVGAATLAVAFRSETLQALESLADRTDKTPEAAAQDEGYWSQVREAFDVEPDFLYFNNGGCCPSPRAVQDAVFKRLKLANRAPSFYLFREMDPEIDAVRKRLAPMFGADPDEIAIVPNATEALATVIGGVPAASGELMVGTNKDYPRVQTALDTRARRTGIKHVEATVPWAPSAKAEMALPVQTFLGAKPALLSIPRVSFLNGMLFPAEEICPEARRHGVFSLVDGAHAVGHVDENLHKLECDAYGCSLHKWFLAPVGCGFLYVRRDRIKDVWPLFPADASLDGDIRKFEQFGTHPTPIPLGLMEAMDAQEAIGRARKAARIQYLRAHWTDQLRDDPKIRFHTSLDPALSRALTTVEVVGLDSGKLGDWLLRKHRIYAVGIARDDVHGVRVTPQIYHTPAETDVLVAALREAARDGLG